MKPRITLLILTVLLASTLVPSASAMGDLEAPSYSEDARCTFPTNWPGIVKNRSNKTIIVRGDLPDDPTQRSYSLYPGQDSDRHTPLCDVDYFTVPDAYFYFKNERKLLEPNEWTPYIGWSTFQCENITGSSRLMCRLT